MFRVDSRLAVLASLLLPCLLLAGCSSTPAEQQVREAIAAAAAATEQGDAGALSDILSENFDGNDGLLDRRRLLGMLRVRRLRDARTTVVVGPIDIEARGERLLAMFTVTLGGGRGLLPDQVGVYKVRTAWRNQDGDWRCYNARWERKM